MAGHAHVTKVEQVEEQVTFQPDQDRPELDRATLAKTAPETVSAETTQLVTIIVFSPLQ